MRKLFILSLLAIMIAIGGCGGGSGGTSADPLGTDSITLESAASQVDSNGTVALKATVKNAAGAAAVGREVSFGFVSNASGATLASAGANTNGAGEATVLYRAGATAGSDVVRASISNGAKMDVSITVVGTPTAAGGQQITVTATPASLIAGDRSVIVAQVNNTDGTAAAGLAVIFQFLGGVAAPSGGSLTVVSATTDASGMAYATYTAGGNSSTLQVEDVVEAKVASITGAVTITRTAAAGGLQMTVTATPASLIAGAVSVIVAQVNNADGTAAAALPVAFQFLGGLAAPSGGSLSAVSATTDASGMAYVTYTAGNNSSTLSIQDVVEAKLVPGPTVAATITRLPATGTGNRISIAMTPNPLATTTSNCIVQATVLRDDGVTPAANEQVTFSIVTGAGTIDAPLVATTKNVTTNNSGIANTIFNPLGAASGETVVRAQIPVTINGGDAIGIIRW